MAKDTDLVRVRYGTGETGWAEILRKSRARLDNIPLQDGLNLDDVVELGEDDDGARRVGVVIRRVWPRKVRIYYSEVGPGVLRKIRAAVKELGGELEAMAPGMACAALQHGMDLAGALATAEVPATCQEMLASGARPKRLARQKGRKAC